jgi:N utilization substance protein B
MKTKRGSRRRAREIALQGLYQWWVSGNAADAIRLQATEAEGFTDADAAYLDALWAGVTQEHDSLAARLAPYLDRKFDDVSPIERSALAIGAWELIHRVEIPYRVAINEAVEIAKAFGGTDGHKFVNGVLDRLAAEVRPREVAQHARRPAAS